MIQKERQRRLVSVVKSALVPVGQPHPRLVQPVTPFKDESSQQKWIEHCAALNRLLILCHVERLGLIE